MIFMVKRVRFVIFLAAFAGGAANASLFEDDYVQSDRLFSPAFSADAAAQGGANAAYLDYIRSLLDQKYPLRSIILHAVSQGISISDTAYLLTLAAPDRASQIYVTAIEMMQDMPGWVCSDHIDLELRYPVFYPVDRLGSRPRIADVAARFFERGEMVGYRRPGERAWRYPDIAKRESHFQASIDELIGLKLHQQQAGGDDMWWYRPGGRLSMPGVDGMPVLVSLYPTERAVLIDATLDQLRQFKADGAQKIPVVIFFNSALAMPTSGQCKAHAETAPAKASGLANLITVDRVAENYSDCGRRLTPPRDWRAGDYHAMVSTSELQNRFGEPPKEEIPPEHWQVLEDGLKQEGFFPPLRITLNRDSRGLWTDERDRIAVAKELGIAEIPTVFLFHEISRESCALQPLCGKVVCRAVVAGGADFGIDECDKQLDRFIAEGVLKEPSGAKDAGDTGGTPESAAAADILRQAADRVR